jgi:hypothetical protein
VPSDGGYSLKVVRGTRQYALALALLATISVPATTCAFAKTTASELQASLAKANIFGPEAKLSVAIDGSGIAISTYRSGHATEQDCKIDAVMAAKAAFSADPEISRVSVFFYDTSAAEEFYEIPVTLGDVTAYGNGSISKDQLLAALKMIQHKAQPSTATPPNADLKGPGANDTTPKQPGTQFTGQPATTTKPSPARQSEGYLYSNYGVQFSYPKSWRIEYPHARNVAVRFQLPTTAPQGVIVEMRVYSSKGITPLGVASLDPSDVFAAVWHASWCKMVSSTLPGAERLLGPGSTGGPEAEDQYERFRQEQYAKTGQRWHGGDYQRIRLPESIKCGSGKSVQCLQRAYRAVPVMGVSGVAIGDCSAYIHYVVFASSPYIVQLDLLCPYKDAYNGATQFNSMLDTLRVQPARGASSASGKR